MQKISLFIYIRIHLTSRSDHLNPLTKNPRFICIYQKKVVTLHRVPVIGWIDDIIAILLAVANGLHFASKIKKSKE